MSLAIRKHLRDFAAIIVLAAIAVGCAAYILNEQRFRMPLIDEEPFELTAELGNAQGVMPGQGQTVRVAGMRVGDLGEVTLENGVAVVKLELDPEYDDLVRADATALLRPRTGLKDMFLELDPGTKATARDGGGRLDPGRQHRARRERRRGPVGARRRHARLPAPPARRARAAGSSGAAATCARSSAGSARSTATSPS